jgi:uncharacterized OB-fold protein
MNQGSLRQSHTGKKREYYGIKSKYIKKETKTRGGIKEKAETRSAKEMKELVLVCDACGEPYNPPRLQCDCGCVVLVAMESPDVKEQDV